MAWEKFRDRLRQEAQQWQSEGLIEPEIEIAKSNAFIGLISRYQLRWILLLEVL